MSRWMFLVLLVEVLVVSVKAGRRHCRERSSLEQREDLASVVVTGTVRELFKDYEHPGQYRAELEVKRIFKGSNSIPNFAGDFRYKRQAARGYYDREDYDSSGAHINSLDHLARLPRPIILVDGIGDPHICESLVRRHDTKIFLLDRPKIVEIQSGGLKLNSSILSITMNNLEHAESAVKSKLLLNYLCSKPLFFSNSCLRVTQYYVFGHIINVVQRKHFFKNFK